MMTDTGFVVLFSILFSLKSFTQIFEKGKNARMYENIESA